MSAFYLKLSLILIISFAVVLALIQTQPAREADLRDFLALPERCPTPCLFGLRPGITDTENAVQGLSRDTRVNHVLNATSMLGGATYGQLAWTWSEDVPALIDTGYPGLVQISSGVVQQITVQTRVPLGFWQAMLGQPETASLTLFGGAIRYRQSYRVGGAIWLISGETVCPWSSAAYWNAPAQLTLAAEPITTPARSPAAVIGGALCDQP